MKDIESLFIEANKAIDEKELAEAKDILEDILSIEPSYGRAHSHIAWIYETKIKDYQKALMHYQLAIKFSGHEYAIAYINYIYLLLELDEHDLILTLIPQALKIKGVDAATLSYQKGRVYEAKHQYLKAHRCYSWAKKNCFDNGFHQFLEEEKERNYSKMNFLKKVYTKFFL